MHRQIILHVGTEKTGTTSIQNFLWQNREQLLSDGYLYPESLGSGPHVAITAACVPFNKNSPLIKLLSVKDIESQYQLMDKIAYGIGIEIERKNPSNLIISDEHICVHLNNSDCLNRLRNFLQRFGLVSKLIIYFRRQDRMLESMISEAIKNSLFDVYNIANPISKANCESYRYRYADILQNLTAAFPDAKLIVRGYPAVGAFDVVDDFVKQAEIESGLPTFKRSRENVSIPGRILRSLSEIGKKASIENNTAILNNWRSIVKYAAEKYPGAPYRLPKEAASLFLKNFETMNSELIFQYPDLAKALGGSDDIVASEVIYDDICYRKMDLLLNNYLKEKIMTKEINFYDASCPVCGNIYKLDATIKTREQKICPECGASGRASAIIYYLCNIVFGNKKPLKVQTKLAYINVIDLSGGIAYREILSSKMSYLNTFFHKEPKLDIRSPSAEFLKCADVLISSEVFEHVVGNSQTAFEGAFKVLKPGGYLIFTVPFINSGKDKEHYPGLRTYDQKIGHDGKWMVELYYEDGSIEIDENPIFHGGPGLTLELRLFNRERILNEMTNAGFCDIVVHDDDIPERGINWGPPSRVITAKRPES